MNTPSEEAKPPLDDLMMAMDVVDTLRHRQDLVARELGADDRERTLVGKLRDIYRQQGIDVPDHILKEGVAALDQERFIYAPPKGGFKVMLARLYVSRGKWGRWAAGIIAALVLALVAYSFVYVPLKTGQEQAARIELTETLPARMDALYNSIYEETKVQTAVNEAEALVARGKAAASDMDRAGAEAAVRQLEAIRDQIRRDYSLRVVNREDVRSGFWTFPEVNTDATNYYIVVEAIDMEGNVVSLPILNEETDQTEIVDMHGLRVPEGVYRAVEADKTDDGIIQRNMVGRKEYGFMEVDYSVPVLGGAVTQW